MSKAKSNKREISKAVESLDALLAKFGEYYGKSMEMLVAAAKVYAEAVDEYGDEAVDAFNAKFPQFTGRDWQLLSKIARREASPKLFVIECVEKVDKVCSLPYKTQVDILGDIDEAPKPLSVLSRGSVVIKTIPEMGSAEIRSLIDTNSGRVRSAQEQIEAAEAAIAKRNARRCWDVYSGGLSVHKQCHICGEELVRLYEELSSIIDSTKSSIGKK